MNYKTILPLLLMSLPFQQVEAQTREVGAFEMEPHLGISLPLAGKGYTDDSAVSFVLGCEARFNFKQKPFDVGLQLDFGNVCHNEVIFIGSWSLFSDYNFRQTQKVSPFVGLGLGFAGIGTNSWGGSEKHDHGRDGLMISPRCGVELLHSFCLTATCNVLTASPDLSYFALTFGVSLGGWKKRKRGE